MTPTSDYALALALALQTVLDRLQESAGVDDLVRAVELGDRLARLDLGPPVDPDVEVLARQWDTARPPLARRLRAVAVDPTCWAPLDDVGDAVLAGDQPDEVVQWGMLLLRVAHVLGDLSAEARDEAAWTLRRGLDRMHLDPARFLPLVGLAAARVEHEDQDRQPAPVQRLLDHMLELPLILASERAAAPVRLDLVRRLRGLSHGPAIAVSTPASEGGGEVLLLRRPGAPVPARLAADSGAVEEPPPEAWVRIWHDETASLSAAEIAHGEGSHVLLSVVLGPGAPEPLSLELPGTIRVEGPDGQPVELRHEKAEPAEWRGAVPGTASVQVRLSWRDEPVRVRFDRPEPPE